MVCPLIRVHGRAVPAARLFLLPDERTDYWALIQAESKVKLSAGAPCVHKIQTIGFLIAMPCCPKRYILRDFGVEGKWCIKASPAFPGRHAVKPSQQYCATGNCWGQDCKKTSNCSPIQCISNGRVVKEYPRCDAHGNPLNYVRDPCSIVRGSTKGPPPIPPTPNIPSPGGTCLPGQRWNANCCGGRCLPLNQTCPLVC